MSILNAITSGAGGVALSGDTSGNLVIQSAGTNVATFTSNYLTLSNQPAFSAYISSGDTTSNSVLIFNTAVVNRGNNYSTSTGLFTAPITGVYVFMCRVRCNGGAGINMAWVKNGSNLAPWWGTAVSTGTNVISGHIAIQLNAGDTFGTLQATAGGSIQGTADYHNMFTGFLLG